MLYLKYAFVDYRISSEEIFNLTNLNCTIIPCEPSKDLYNAICGHPDILLHFVNDKKIIIHKETSINFEKKLHSLNFEVLRSNNALTSKYPGDIILNAVNTSSFFIHNINYTDKVLLKEVNNKNLITVKQGYTKCSTVVLSDKAFITSDITISNALSTLGCEVLLLPPGDITLPGLDYGFIGGTCGMLDSNTIVFYGNLDRYPHGATIKTFLEKHNISPIYLDDTPLIDRGSIFFLDA